MGDNSGRDKLESPAPFNVDRLRANIDHKRIDAHITSRRELARRAGINENTFSNFFREGRKDPLDAEQLYKLARVFGCTMEELITGNAPEPVAAPVYSTEVQQICNQLEHMTPEQLAKIEFGIAMLTAGNFQKGDGQSA